MEIWKMILNRLFVRSIPQIIWISVPSYVFAAVVFAMGLPNAFVYLANLAAAYAMIITIVGMPRIAGSIYHEIIGHPLTRRLMQVSWVERFMKDITFQTEISLYQGLFINLLYIVLKLWSGIYFGSLWFWSLAVYYIMLIIVRFLLLRQVNRDSVGQNLPAELHRYRVCAILLLVMNQALAVIVMLIVYQNRSYHYPGLLIYGMAAYSIYAVTIAIINLIKFYKIQSPILWAAKAINLVAALVSLLSLETAMIARFGSERDAVFRRVVTGATGCAICMFVLGLAIYMLFRADRELEKMGLEK